MIPTAQERSELLRASGAFDGCTDEQLAALGERLQPLAFAPGGVLVAEGQPADRWYLIAEGSAEVTRVNLIGEAVTLAVLGPGHSFGERALVSDRQPRSATVKALTSMEVFSLDGAAFQEVVRADPSLNARFTGRLEEMAIDTALKRASPFASLPHDVLCSLAALLQSQIARKDEVIVRQGDAGTCLYLLRSGSVAVTMNKRHVAVLRAGDWFGELALLTSARRSATVTALEDTELLVLERDAFEAVAREHVAIAAHFRELLGGRFHGAPDQHVLLPDPLTTIMPLVSARRRKRYWIVLLMGVVGFTLLSFAAAHGGGTSAVYAMMVVGAVIGPIVFVEYLAESNILAERPLELLAAAVIGAAGGLPLAFSLQHESGIVPVSLPSALLIAGIEEPAKLIGVVWLLRLPALRFRMDGVIFGAAAGMGFACIETILYALARVETANVLVGVLWFRALLSPFTHGTWTAIVCATLWRERASGLRNATLRIGAALAAAIILHGLWDWPGLPFPMNFLGLMVVGAASVLILRAILHRAALEEARSVTALAPELVHVPANAVGLRCVGCGRRAPAGARYCPRCGLALRHLDRAS